MVGALLASRLVPCWLPTGPAFGIAGGLTAYFRVGIVKLATDTFMRTNTCSKQINTSSSLVPTRCSRCNHPRMLASRLGLPISGSKVNWRMCGTVWADGLYRNQPMARLEKKKGNTGLSGWLRTGLVREALGEPFLRGPIDAQSDELG